MQRFRAIVNAKVMVVLVSPASRSQQKGIKAVLMAVRNGTPTPPRTFVREDAPAEF
jgi:hypothetical protein